MSNHIADISFIIQEFITKGGRYAWGNGEFDLKKEIQKGDSSNLATLETLTQVIYSSYYAVNPARTLKQTNLADPAFVSETTEFTKFLSFNNSTRLTTDPGWIVESVLQYGQLKVSKAGVSLTLDQNQYEPTTPTTPLATGSIVIRKMLKESTELQPVFYYAFSEAHFLHSPIIMRYYWNIRPAGSASLIREISQYLNKYRVPYIFKCLNHPAYYDRRDSAVLYVCKQYHHIMNELLPLIYSEVAGYMVDDIPMFTFRVATGLGYADSPVSGESFGMHRSKLLAKGLIAGTLQNTTDKDVYMSHIAFQFGEANIDPAVPYLCKDSKQTITPLQ